MRSGGPDHLVLRGLQEVYLKTEGDLEDDTSR